MIKAEFHSFKFDIILKKAMSRQEVADHIKKAIEEIAEEGKSMLWWINYFKYDDVVVCENDKYFHFVDDRLYSFEGKDLCKECIETIFKLEEK